MRDNTPAEATRLEILLKKVGLADFVALSGEEPYHEERQRLRFDMAVLKGWTAWQLKEYDQTLAAFLAALEVSALLHQAKLRQWMVIHLLERRHDYAQPPVNGCAPQYTLSPVSGDPPLLEEQRLTMPPNSEDASLTQTHPQVTCYNTTTLTYLTLLHRLLLLESQLFGRAAPVYFAYHARVEFFTGMVLLPIAPGTFLMGSPENEAGRYNDEVPQHSVTLTRPFWLGRYPVTQAEYEKVMGNNPSEFKGENRPVESVSWEEAMEFCRKLTEQEQSAGVLPAGYEFRLPTEAEWEYCCRAGSSTVYCYGNDEERLADYAWYDKNSNNETHEVGLKKANAWGLHDMHGNVYEWCLDRIESLTGYDKVKDGVLDPLSDSGQSRVIRGGSWFNTGRNCRSAFRGALVPANRRDSLGFHICLAPSPAGRADHD